MKTLDRLKSSTHLAGSLVAVAFVGLASYASAAPLVSDQFVFGYGAQVDSTSNTWVKKTSGLATIGDFTFQPTVVGGIYSALGPNYNGTSLISTPDASSNYSARTNNFGFSINGSWAGDPSVFGPSVTLDDVQIKLVITSVSVYATYYSQAPDSVAPTIALMEKTTGHEDVFTVFNAKKTVGGTDYLNALTKSPNYELYTWNPDDFWIDGADAIRSFGFQIGQAGNLAIDGLRIEGYVTVSVIPEPSSIVLLCGGAGAFLFYARKRRTAL